MQKFTLFDKNNKAVNGMGKFYNLLEIEQDILIQYIERILQLRHGIKDFAEDNKDYLELLKEIKVVLENNSELINKQDPDFLVSPLHIAAGSGLFELAKLLLEFGADKTLKNCFEQTPAERARSYAGRNDIANYIDNFKSNVEPKVVEIKPEL